MGSDDSRLEKRAAVGVLVVWAVVVLTATATGDITVAQIVTAVALIAAGYLFGVRIVKNGRNG